MCLIAFAYKISPEYPLILIANRDEFYERPTQKAHFWKTDHETKILAGKDLKGGGTWLGVNDNQKWAAVTNYRDLENIKNDAPTRGDLIPSFLNSSKSGENFLLDLKGNADQYNGFNLLVGDENGIYHYSNVSDVVSELEPGIHGVSNALLNTPWPKLNFAREALSKEIKESDFSEEALFQILKDTGKAQKDQLPETGLSKTLEKELSSVFIDTDGYGTRCSTLLLKDKVGDMKFVERTYDLDNRYEFSDRMFELDKH
ncbi:hypothetical protein CW751_05185 [Brumimicrobium salinarum]|uniref:NRDE family protein n=1 Tax=Brumimicrobium salinarum TaxID=2058658 RepID=A0A2I0R4I0_9FLAO|nr:NRDE family protein [Brumimicrobium salinarum]PKR81449.1 hypothetical protein CW751_05185 [Brumimicrobium salinarum]